MAKNEKKWPDKGQEKGQDTSETDEKMRTDLEERLRKRNEFLSQRCVDGRVDARVQWRGRGGRAGGGGWRGTPVPDHSSGENQGWGIHYTPPPSLASRVMFG